MKDLNHASSDPLLKMPMAPPIRGSPDMATYHGGRSCRALGISSLGHITWQSISSVAGMWILKKKKIKSNIQQYDSIRFIGVSFDRREERESGRRDQQ